MAQRGRPAKNNIENPILGPTTIRKPSDEEKEASKKWKSIPPIVSYDVLKIYRDGKKVIKVRKVEKRGGIVDQRLVFQSVNGKPTRQLITEKQLIAAGVDLRF